MLHSRSKEANPAILLDSYDEKILAILAENGRISARELSERVGLSQTPTLRRVRILEKSGVIAGYHADIDAALLGRKLNVLVFVSLERQTEEALALFEQHIAQVPEVMACFMISGDADYVLRVLVPDLDTYHRFLMQHLTRMPGVTRISSNFAVKTVFQRAAPPLGSEKTAR